MLRAVVEDLDERLDGDAIARRASYGRYHLDHEVKQALGEAPGVLRRRLLLERAAHRLATTDRLVLEVAAEAHYSSQEAFSRAFRRAFGVTPGRFRSMEAQDHRLPAPNGVHYRPAPRRRGRSAAPSRPMDLGDRLIEHDNWLGARLLECAAQLDDETLDLPVPLEPPSPAFGTPEPSIREMLHRLFLAKEMWTASLDGRDPDAPDDVSLAGLAARQARAGARLVALVAEIRNRDAWDTAYLDTVHEPPATTTFGAAIAHLLAWNAVRREIIAGALGSHGLVTVTLDPIAWEHGDGPEGAGDGIRLPGDADGARAPADALSSAASARGARRNGAGRPARSGRRGGIPSGAPPR